MVQAMLLNCAKALFSERSLQNSPKQKQLTLRLNSKTH